MKFQARVIPSGNATAVEIPPQVIESLGPEARSLIVITINGHSWRSRVALKHGKALAGISAANRAASGIAEGDLVEIDLERDTEPRVVDEPPDLAQALDADLQARAAFEQLAYGFKRKHVTHIEGAKSPETRQRRIAKLVETLHLGG